MRRALLLICLSLTAGCVTRPRPAPTPVAVQPPPAAPQPTGHGTLAVPSRLADGSYATPNSALSAAATLWHLRAGLNVAALSCRGPQEAVLTAGYNALLRRDRAAFDAAYRTLGREHGDAARFDAAMTALYNYYALGPARPGLCAAAGEVLTQAAALAPDQLAAFAPGALAQVEAPYQRVFAEQDAFLANRPGPVAAGVQTVAAVTPRAATQPAPRIAIDQTVLRMP